MYIEAIKESHVTDAIRGLRMIRVSKGAKQVPEKEMVDAITISQTARSTLGEQCFNDVQLYSVQYLKANAAVKKGKILSRSTTCETASLNSTPGSGTYLA